MTTQHLGRAARPPAGRTSCTVGGGGGAVPRAARRETSKPPQAASARVRAVGPGGTGSPRAGQGPAGGSARAGGRGAVSPGEVGGRVYFCSSGVYVHGKRVELQTARRSRRGHRDSRPRSNQRARPLGPLRTVSRTPLPSNEVPWCLLPPPCPCPCASGTSAIGSLPAGSGSGTGRFGTRKPSFGSGSASVLLKRTGAWESPRLPPPRHRLHSPHRPLSSVK